MENQALFDENPRNRKKNNKRRNKRKRKKAINNLIIIINNIQNNCNGESIIKYILLILFFITLFFAIKFLLFNKINITSENEKIAANKNINDIKIIDSDLVQNNLSCFPTDNKIFWEKQKRLDIIKAKKLIRNSNSVQISFENTTQFYKRKNPKVSLIITIYNQAKYIHKLYAHIQKQELKDIEIIFVDDASNDNSSFIINELMEKDKRIIYLKNEINKKQFYSINFGILNSNGEYIIVIDPDDLIINNILIKAYKTAKYYNLDILQFHILHGKKFPILWRQVKYKDGIICSNQNVRNVFYHGVTRNLCDKLIKRNIYLKSIKFMKKEFYNEDYHMHTDDTIFFGIIHFANSYGFLEEIGYFYNLNPNRKINNITSKEERINANMKSLFNIMKYFFIQSDNNEIEKNYIAYKFFKKKIIKEHGDYVNLITKGFDFYIEVLNLYINSTFFNQEKKGEIIKFKEQIIKRKNSINGIIK